jgi:methionyl-tRNA synthetase
MVKNKFYVTTPIYYATAAPHLGSLYSTLLADVAKRYHQLKGEHAFFLTGTDEYGQKVATAAQKAGKQPQEFVDSFIDAYKNMWARYNLSYDYFMRTTSPAHKDAVQAWLQKLIDKGEIYKSVYTGWYCLPDESFVTPKDQDQNQTIPLCPDCGRQTTQVSEECYFFKLSVYQDRLLAFYKENPNFIVPKERLQEVIRFVEGGLKDLSISRTTVTWGIPFPGDSKHVTYVWADALNNYITAIGYGSNDAEKQYNFSYWWPADLQVLGKDIVRFHAVYWPAFLMASDLALPRQLLVHGWLKVGAQKMSKSLGNAVDPQYLAETYGADEIRYYLISKMAITQDSEFNIQAIENTITNELANELGNLLHRISALTDKYNFMHVQPPKKWSPRVVALQKKSAAMAEQYEQHMNQQYFYRAVGSAFEFVKEINAYFHEQEPWKQAKHSPEAFKETISASLHALHRIGIMLTPIMPTKMDVLLESIGIKLNYQHNKKQSKTHAGLAQSIFNALSKNMQDWFLPAVTEPENFIEFCKTANWNHTYSVKKVPVLFAKIEPEKES